ncbi:hypothetical protein CEXT_62871 [Caerostris extrusa]|uniref:Uncharacterized protein n=1 Tax=Caerostris extrusa TaxID=172846 RepID=A0AAV4XP30_CAEEX|nr:hypothetical protein CEXT_62871 [Caerostris extrusa]
MILLLRCPFTGDNALFHWCIVNYRTRRRGDEGYVKETERTKRVTETIKRGPCAKNPSLLLMKLLQCHLGCALRKQALD